MSVVWQTVHHARQRLDGTVLRAQPWQLESCVLQGGTVMGGLQTSPRVERWLASTVKRAAPSSPALAALPASTASVVLPTRHRALQHRAATVLREDQTQREGRVLPAIFVRVG